MSTFWNILYLLIIFFVNLLSLKIVLLIYNQLISDKIIFDINLATACKPIFNNNLFTIFMIIDCPSHNNPIQYVNYCKYNCIQFENKEIISL